MSASKSKIVVNAGNPAVRIEVVDSNFQVRSKGYGRIEDELPAGLYTVRYRAGDAVEESDIHIQPNQPLKVTAPPRLEFGSAAPIEQTRASHDVHQAHASRLSHKPQVKQGHGSEFFLFVRDLVPGGKGHPMHGMSLHALDGTRLVNFEKESSRNTNKKEALWAGCTVALKPGSYRLRLALTRDSSVETIIVACPGWQSQMFFLRANNQGDPGRYEPLDLSGTTQLMAKTKSGFNPSQIVDKNFGISKAGEDIRVAELARLAVANNWRGFHTKDLNALLRGKFHDPLLGILGLHLLLMRPEPDWKLAERTHRHLKEDLLQGFIHPDVEALGVEIALRQKKKLPDSTIESPPMLRRSWNSLLQASVHQPSLLPGDAFCSIISDRLWGDGAWLSWVTPEKKLVATLGGSKQVEKKASRKTTSPVAFNIMASASGQNDYQTIQKSVLELTSSLQELVQEHRDVTKLAKKADLDRGELTLLSYLLMSWQLSPGDEDQPNPRLDELFSLERLVSSLGIPADRIQTTMAGLLQKLEPAVQHR